MKSYGLTAFVASSLKHQLQLKMLRSLALVPLDKVEEAFNIIKEELPVQFEPLINYFDRNYVNGEEKIGRNGRIYHIAPKYPPKLWNIHLDYLRNEQSTTNMAESWHRRIKAIVGSKSVNVNVLISHLEKEAACVSNNTASTQSGRINIRQKKNSGRECVVRVLNNYDDYSSLYSFLKHIAKNI